MRKLVIVALAAAFMAAMATYTLATEFKFGGSWAMRGIYWDIGLDKGVGNNHTAGPLDNLDDVNFYDVRLRMDMCAKVSDKLSFHAQADSGLGYPGDYERDNPLSTPDSYHGILSSGGVRELGEIAPAERGSWAARGTDGFAAPFNFPAGNEPLDPVIGDGTTGSTSSQRDILFQRAYLKWHSPIGQIKAGRMWAYWGRGLVEGMNRNRVEWELENQSWCVGAGLDKWAEGSIFVDSDDTDHYFVWGKITQPNFEFGPYFGLARVNRPDSITPRVRMEQDTHLYYNSWMWKCCMGDVEFGGEYVYKWGKTGALVGLDQGQNYNQHGLVYDITYSAGSCKVGYQQGYFTGDSWYDRNDTTNTYSWSDTAFKTSYSFSPFLILGEVIVNGLAMDGRRIGADNVHANYMSNCHYWRWFAEAAPVRNLSVTASVGYAKANQPIHSVNRTDLSDGAYLYGESKGKSMGTEVDITGTYKLTDNLSYTAAWGYLWTGGYWDTSTGPQNGISTTSDDALVLLHQIAITF